MCLSCWITGAECTHRQRSAAEQISDAAAAAMAQEDEKEKQFKAARTTLLGTAVVCEQWGRQSYDPHTASQFLEMAEQYRATAVMTHHVQARLPALTPAQVALLQQMLPQAAGQGFAAPQQPDVPLSEPMPFSQPRELVAEARREAPRADRRTNRMSLNGVH